MSELHLEWLPLSQLKEWDRNHKLHDIGAIVTSIERYGFRDAVILDAALGENVVIAGNGRIEALRMMKAQGKQAPRGIRIDNGEWLVPTQAGVKSKSRAEAESFGTDHNALVLSGGDYDLSDMMRMWDDGTTEFLQELAAADELPVSVDADDLGRLLAMEQVPQEAPEAQIDKAAELQEKWQVKRGDLWHIGGHRLLCGDSTKPEDVERVMGREKTDAIVTDPPYGMNLDTDWSGIRGTGQSLGFKKSICGKAYAPVYGDDKPFDPTPIFELWARDCQEIFLFGADYYSERIPARCEGSWLVWDKRKESQAEGFGSEFELIWSKARHKRRILRHEWFGFLRAGEWGESRVHPTQKPISLIEDIIKQWCSGDIVGDPYVGSGTTIVACQNLGRKCLAAEISPAYCSVTLQRLSDMGLECKRIE